MQKNCTPTYLPQRAGATPAYGLYTLLSHSVGYRTLSTLTVELEVLDLQPSHPQGNLGTIVLLFGEVAEAVRHFESLVSHLKEFDL